MIDNPAENLSALIDGELSETEAHRLVDKMASDEQLSDTWARYQLTRDALRNQLPPYVSRDLAVRVRNCVKDEPAILAPQRRSHTRLRWVRHTIGAAVAASVAAVAILSLQPAGDGTKISPFDTAQTATGTGIHWNNGEPDVESKLNLYLVNHNEFAPSNSMKGMFPYATLVGYEAGRR